MNKNTFLNELERKSNQDFIRTENGAIARSTTNSKVLDLFALGGAYRNRSDEDCIDLFVNAYTENPNLAIKCLFYLRDCRGGAGERRFFRICYKWLCQYDTSTALFNLPFIPEYGRWDDILYIFNDTRIEKEGFNFIARQLLADIDAFSKGASISSLAKWMPSENASSKETKELAKKLRIKYLNLSSKQYRVCLSQLREKLNIVERQMAANQWSEIQFDKIPSKAGLKYQKAFAKHQPERYLNFMQDKNTKVNASVLNPMEVVRKVVNGNASDEVIEKYWKNLKDYYCGKDETGIAVIDVSGSMTGTPMNAAIGLGLYIAKKSHGDFANSFITFSREPKLIKLKNDNSILKDIRTIHNSDWGYNTNIEKVFDLLFDVIKSKNVSKDDIPKRLYIFSDMEFDRAFNFRGVYDSNMRINTLIEDIRSKWKAEGYDIPQIIFWNLNARQDNIAAIGDKFSYVSGFNASMIETILSGKTGYDLMLEKLMSERYNQIGYSYLMS